MANNFMQHQFSMTNNQISQLESISNKLDPTIQMGEMGSMSSLPVSQQISMPAVPMATYDPGQRLSFPNQQVASMGSHQYVMANMQPEEMEAMLQNARIQQLSAQNKRKTPMDSILNMRAPQQMSMPNKRMTQMDRRPWLQQMPAPNRKVVQMQLMPSNPGSPRPPTQTKVVQLESFPGKSGSQQSLAPKYQTSHMQPAKARSESFESVRSKMRESLAAALALASQQQEKSSKTEKNSQSEDTNSPKDKVENSQPAEPVSAAAYVNDHGTSNSTQVSSGFQECQPSIISVDEDTSFTDSFFVKDDLLQGNGLTWVMEMEADKIVSEEKEIAAPEEEKLDQVELVGVVKEKYLPSPQDLASEIEAELFKFHGGVNKKYKEKGRSLLFNLKDRNNPELRERVMSGDITPERLCSMTAEELASKELSEWRIAKAEELAQMVVLQDTDVDVRRLVKKTHKGEFQVEVEQDDGISVEVAVGTSLLTRSQSRAKEMESRSPTESKESEDREGEKSSAQNDVNEGTITIPSIEGSDLLQGLMADDDEVKDKDLPPIVSLDEFMQSLDSEPPFENLKAETGKSTPTTDKNDSDVAFALKSSSQSPRDQIGAAGDEPEKADKKLDVELKPSRIDVISGFSPVSIPKGEDVWEGLLQLNIASKAAALGYFKSGEKASTKDWPGVLDIKGRVRLDAFEKFLQGLRMSRSRAIMVVHFASKDGSSESEIASIRELADLYVSDDRVGFAEPVTGVELYFCPCHAKTIEMLNKHLPKDYTEALDGVNDGLVGVVVWRKGHVSPNPSSVHKKKHHHHSSSRRHQQEKYPNPASRTHQGRHPGDDDEEDDVPPGFGPGAAREDDDLPEFNFGSQNPSRYNKNPNSPAGGPPRPVEQMRELIYKYGKPKGNAAAAPPGSLADKRDSGGRVRKWNDDDDDDIPEWQPPENQVVPPEPPVLHHSLLRPHMVHQHPQQQPMLGSGSVVYPQPPMGQNGAPAWQPQGGGWWAPPPPPANNGQYYGVPGAAPPPPELPRRRDF